MFGWKSGIDYLTALILKCVKVERHLYFCQAVMNYGKENTFSHSFLCGTRKRDEESEAL